MSNSTYPTIQCGIGNRTRFTTLDISEATKPSIGAQAIHGGYWIVAEDSMVLISDHLAEISGWKEDVEYELDNNPSFPEGCYVSQFPVVFIPRDF